jgi:Calcineurin-like phosphoesterase
MVDADIALGSDLLVILGDYFATHRFVIERVPHAAWAAELARLKAPLGVYAILGNHDWWYDIEGVRTALRQVRIPVMERSWKTTPCCWASRAAGSGWPGSAINSPIGSAPINSRASTTCLARLPACAATIR